MYKNVGKKIKVVSILLFIIGVLVSIYVGVMLHILSNGSVSTDSDEIITGSIIIVAGAVASWLVSLVIYGFGLIVESAEKTDEIKDILVDIREKKPDYRTAEEKANKTSNSILASSFNNEVFDDRQFSASSPKAPAYVQPTKPSGSADPKFVAPTYAGQGKSRPTVPLFRDDMSAETPISNPAPVAKPAAVNETSYEEPKYEEPKYEEPKYEEPKYEEPKYEEPKYEEPVYEAPVVNEPAVDMPKVPTMNVQVHTYAPVQEQPVSAQPVYSEPDYAEPTAEQKYEAPAAEQSYAEPSYSNDVYAAPVSEPVSEAAAENTASPEDEERFRQIEDLIYKFVARRNGKVNINDILRTVPRNIEPSEFSAAVKKLEMDGRLDKDDKGEYYAL